MSNAQGRTRKLAGSKNNKIICILCHIILYLTALIAEFAVLLFNANLKSDVPGYLHGWSAAGLVCILHMLLDDGGQIVHLLPQIK